MWLKPPISAQSLIRWLKPTAMEASQSCQFTNLLAEANGNETHGKGLLKTETIPTPYVRFSGVSILMPGKPAFAPIQLKFSSPVQFRNIPSIR